MVPKCVSSPNRKRSPQQKKVTFETPSPYDDFNTSPITMHSFLLPPVLPSKPFCKAIWLLSSQTNTPPLPQHTKNCLLKYNFSKNLTHNQRNLKQFYDQGIQVQVTNKNIKREDRLCMKFQPLKHSAQRGSFEFFTPICAVSISNNISRSRSGST